MAYNSFADNMGLSSFV